MAASSPAETAPPSASWAAPARGCSAAGSPHSRWAQRASRSPGARGSLTTRAGALAASSSRKPSTDEMSANRCKPLAVQPQLGRRLRPAQHQHRQQRHRLRWHAEHAPHVVLELDDAAAAALEHQAQRLEAIGGGQHLGIGGLDHRRACGLLVAAGHQRIERQRIGVGNGVLLLDQHAEHAGLEGGQRAQRPRPRNRRRPRSPRH